MGRSRLIGCFSSTGRGRGLLLLLAGGEDLHVAGAVAVDGDPLAVRFVGEPVDLFHVLVGGGVGEVDGLGDGVVGVALEGRLHPDVVLGGDVVGGDENLPDFFGDFGQVVHGAVLGDLLHQLIGVKALFLGDVLEHRVNFDQLVVVHHLADEGDRKERLDAGRSAGDDGNGAGRGDGGDGGVPDRSLSLAGRRSTP